MGHSGRRKMTIVALAIATFVPTASMASAQDDVMTQDAAKHFELGVSLYSEADYRAALVEFERAYALAPNATVSYNIAEAQYQLQDYASALATFERYLSQTSSGDPRRGEVEQTIGVLHQRVGRLNVETDPVGADVAVDDQPVGRTPFDQPIVVSVGHRKVTASMAGRPTITRFVDVATQDTVPVRIPIPALAADGARSETGSASLQRTDDSPGRATQVNDSLSSRRSSQAWLTVGWTATGVLAAGAVTFGILALKSSNDLSQARSTFPTTSATLDHDATLTKTYSILADSLGAAAIAVGCVSLAATLSSHRESPALQAWLGPTSAHFQMTF